MKVAKAVSALRKSVSSIVADNGLLDKEAALAASASDFRVYLIKNDITGEALAKAEQEGEAVVNEARASLKLAKDTAMDKLSIFVPITKYDAEKRLAYGTIACDVADKSKEIMDYESAVPEFKKWSDEIAKNSGGKSVGNVRVMHQPIVGGKMISLDYDDKTKTIMGVSKVLNDETAMLIEEGALTGFSIGGGYAKRWTDPTDSSLRRYTPTIAEVSYVDNPCIPGATFEFVKRDGSTELRKFSTDDVHQRVMAIATELAKRAADSAYGGADSTKPKGDKEGLGDQDGRQGHDAKDGNTDTKLADKSKPKTGAKDVNPKDDGEAQNRHAEPKSDSKKEKGADSTVDKAAPTNAEVAEHATELAKAAGKEKEWWLFVEAARADLVLKAAAASKETGVITEVAAAAKADVGPQGEDIGASQVWTHPDLPGETFGKKADLRVGLLRKSADVAADKAAEPVVSALKEITDLLGTTKKAEKVAAKADPAAKVVEEPVVAKREYSADERKKYASEGVAMSDGSYPIPDKGALEDAVSAYGRASNKVAAKRHIIKRAKALGATGMLPENWSGSGKMYKTVAMPESAVTKGAEWFSVQNLVRLLAEVEGAMDALEVSHKALKADGVFSDVTVAKLSASLFVAGDAVADALDETMKSLKSEEADEAMLLATKVAGAAALLAKAGARHSSKDKKLIQQAHDAMVDLDPDCCDSDGDDDDDAKKGVTADLEKMTAERDALTKAMSTLAASLPDVLGEVKVLKERLEKVEKSPAGVTQPGARTYRIAEKADDMKPNTVDENALEKALASKAFMDQLADTAVRVAQRNPMHAMPGLNYGGDKS